MPAVQFKDYYQTLSVERSADEKAIQAAFRKLARKHHPDINPGDKQSEERFKEINEAYEVLSDPEKRKMYDRFGEDWQRYRDAGFTGNEPTGGGRPGPAFDDYDFGSWFTGQSQGGQSHRVEFGENASGFSDFFQTLFGGLGNRRGGFVPPRTSRRRGEDIEVSLEVSFDESFRGASRRFEVQTHEPCTTCNGTGIARGATCPTCDGSGVVPKAKTIEVKIPAGVTTGSRIRVAGHGGAGQNGGPNGDVYLRVTVQPDSRFERTGDDLRTEVEVPLYTAILGGEALVSTPTGRVAMTIPPETQAGKLFRLRGQGMPRLKGGKNERGDLLARARIVLPTTLTDRERALFQQLRDLRDERSS
ncbi:MAG: molecular chaperone DnaJ [Thermomicrobiales bacterium]|jgi:DnaJ-class molecular chaperone|nr:molecular chaperone DnaJ [Thermomicrobiales bacterium]